jgi:uncharacterized protein YjiS (DUF1127 family)
MMTHETGPHPVPDGPGLPARLLRQLWTRPRTRRPRPIGGLSHLSDHQLRDIGISRDQFPRSIATMKAHPASLHTFKGDLR